MTPRYILLVVSVVFSNVISAAENDDSLRLVDTQEYKSPNGQLRIDNGKVIFSHYSQDGNNQDIIAIDPKSASAEILVSGVRDAQYVAADDRYLVYSAGGANARPLAIINRASGSKASPIRLRNHISWGHIFGDQLVAFQNEEALFFRLPDLKLERTKKIAGGRETQLWKSMIVTLGRKLAIYDSQLAQIAVSDLPPRDPAARQSCEASNLRIYNDLAVIGVNCDQIAIYQLPNGKLLNVISAIPRFPSFDVLDGLLFVGSGDSYPIVGMRVYELSSGLELARLSVEAHYLFANEGRLLAMSRSDWNKPVRFSSYEPIFSSIRSESRRIARIQAGCVEVDLSSSSQDVYSRIDKCETAGILSYTTGQNFPSEIEVALTNYAGWLAQTISRYREAVPILDKLAPSLSRGKILAMARRKSSALEPAAQERRLQRAREIVGVKKIDMDFGAFSNLFLFSENRAYVARWNCGENSDPGVTIDALDRDTFSLIKRVVVANCDDDYQDDISSIGQVPGYLILALEYRYEEPRDNVAVIDSKSLELVSKGRIAVNPNSLAQWNGQLLRCSTLPGEPHTRFDPLTARLVPTTDQEAIACLNGEVKPVKATRYDSDAADRPELVTSKYRIYEESGKYPLRYFRFSATAQGGVRTDSTPRPYVGIHETQDSDTFVLRYMNNSEQRIALFNVATQTERILVAFKPSDPDVSSAVWRSFLFVASGRDLFVYNIEKQHFSWYEKDFIREGLEPICSSCNDRNGIRRLLLDGNRLLLLTLDGHNSRTIDLPAFINQFGNTDFFESYVGQTAM